MLTETPEWKALEAHRRTWADLHMRDLVANDKGRLNRFALKTSGLFFSFSRNIATDETLRLLLALARAREVERWRDRMFSGEKINVTENRAVLHTALRRPPDDKIFVDGENIMPFVHDILEKMREFSQSVRSGQWTGFSGRPVRDVVNIGIGGSDLGPSMVCEALKVHSSGGIRVHFVSNVDGAHLHETLKDCSPETTLFLVASKTFTTQETMINAAVAKRWILEAFGDERSVSRHFVALSANEKAAQDFGISPENVFPFRDWVGGRFSVWSSIGLSICLALGFENFERLLAGAHAMDRHFCEAPLEKNMPVILALLGVWYRNFWGMRAYAVAPYSQDLRRFPAWLQQVDMESNGKCVDREGRVVSYPAGPTVFGEPGTNAQHAFFQLLHQGTDVIPCDFIAAIEDTRRTGEQHMLLLANMLAQAQALMEGRSSADEPWRDFPGNRPSNTILLDRLDAFHLGMLLALYEHKVFVQGVIWNINSFDQWGVELGKTLARDTFSVLSGKTPENMIKTIDSQTLGITNHIQGT